MTAVTPQMLADLRAKADAATPGPWVEGDHWQVAGVMPRLFGENKCASCSGGNPLVWEGRRDINGEIMLAHVHQTSEPWIDDGIFSFHDISHPTCVVVETNEYGGCTREDRAFIAATNPETVRQLLDHIDALEATIARVRDVLDQAERGNHTSVGAMVSTFPLRNALSKGDAQRCPKCGGMDGSHGLVHTRYGNGGGNGWTW